MRAFLTCWKNDRKINEEEGDKEISRTAVMEWKGSSGKGDFVRSCR